VGASETAARQLTGEVPAIIVAQFLTMKILVIGGGGREHAIVWKLRQSPLVEHVWCAPGNGGISGEAECIPVDAGNVNALVSLAESLKPDLTVVGPEVPLVAGIVNEFVQRGMKIVGPDRAAAQLEGSKIFAKQFMLRHGIPTAPVHGIFDSVADAGSAIGKVNGPVVIKADGLCAGKGVLVTSSPEEAKEFLERLMVQHEFGESGNRVLIEEALTGEELSYIILTDGESLLPLAPSRDHKRAFDGNRGPNTGGMGAYSSDDLMPRELSELILKSIVSPTIRGLREEGWTYRGFLYFGLMLTKAGPKVLEFNCRMGDPETQAILMRMDFDFAAALSALVQGGLAAVKPLWKKGASVVVVLASGGYPGGVKAGHPISGLSDAVPNPAVKVFHAATRRDGGIYYTSGGRVLGVSALGDSIGEAARKAYDAISKTEFIGMHFRKDIGTIDVSREVCAGGGKVG
jgi:phosphoribosylamine--glycine ligase